MSPHGKTIVHLAFACAALLGASGCVMFREEPVPRAPTLSFVASEDPPIEAPPVANAGMRVAGPEVVPAIKEERPASEREPRYSIAANDLRIRYDNLAATVALAPDSLDSTGREKLKRMRDILSELDGGLMRLKMADADTVPGIEGEVERTLGDGDRLLQELSAEVAAGRAGGRK